MTKIKLKHLHIFRDRHGKRRAYLRLPGRKAMPLPGAIGSPEFMQAYTAALADVTPPAEIGAGRTVPGTINAAIIGYYASAAFAALAPKTRRERRYVLERLRAAHGDKRIALLGRSHIDAMVASKAGTPSAARSFLKALRAVIGHCFAQGWRADDPTQGIKLAPLKTSGFRTWSEGDIVVYEAAHPIGTRARLALALPLYTALRRADLVGLGPQHIRDGVIHIRTKKTGVTLAIPVHPELARVLDATPSGHLTFLVTKDGKPFTPAGFTNWFGEVCREVGLPRGLSAHGLRKAACRRLAEAGCSANLIASISGHASLREVQRYTAAADQARMARAAIATMLSAFPQQEHSLANPPSEVCKPERKPLK